MSTLIWNFGNAIRWRPLLLLSGWTLGLTLSLFPALSVVVIQSLSKNLSTNSSPESVLLLCILVAVLIGGSSGLRQLYYSLSRIYAVSFSQRIAFLFYSAVISYPTTYLSKALTAKKLRSSREAVAQSMCTSLLQAVENLILAAITSVTLAISLWNISPLVAVLSTLAIIPEVCTYMWVGKFETKYWTPASEALRRATYLEDQISYQAPLTELGTLSGQRLFLTKATDSRQRYSTFKTLVERKSAIAYVLGTVTTTVLIALCILTIIRQGTGDFGIIAAGIIGVSSGISAIRSVGYQVGELGQSLPAARTIQRFIHNAPGETTSAIPAASTVRQLHVENLAVRYTQDGPWALQPTTLTLDAGKIYAVVGRNGAGKSTFLNALVGRIDSQGNISFSPHVDGRVFSTIDQNFGHFELTVREFITLGSPHTEEQLQQATTFAGAAEVIAKLPAGIDSQLGAQWEGHDLSGGQWQKLALARMFVQSTPIWILDEPTSAIDAEAEAVFFNTLEQHKNDHITVIVSHRLTTLRSVDHVFVLKEGRLVEQGSPKELIQNKESEFYELFHSQLTA